MSFVNSTVVYKNVSGFVGYRVGSDGSIWSRWKTGCTVRIGKEWRQLNGSITKYGYTRISLVHPIRKNFYLHRLVLLTFVGPCPDGMEACHNDGNPANNSLGNLRWDTVKSNIHDAIKHGTFIRGERVASAILTKKEVLAIRLKYSPGKISMRTLGEKYGVSYATIRHIVAGRTWKHVSGPIIKSDKRLLPTGHPTFRGDGRR